MKIKNKFIIPVVALIVALIMTGAPVATVAADTEASDSTTETTTTSPAWDHDYTYKPITNPPTSSIDEEIDAAVSSIFGSTTAPVDDDIRDTVSSAGNFVTMMKNLVDKLIEFVKKIGDFFSGNSLGGLLDSLTSTTAAE